MMYLILTVLFWGATPILDKVAATNADVTVIVFVRSITVAIAGTIILLGSGNAGLLATTSWKTIGYMVVSAFLAGCLGIFTFTRALQVVNDTGKVAVLTSTYPLVALLLSVLFLQEKITLYKGLGSVFVVIGIFFLNF